MRSTTRILICTALHTIAATSAHAQEHSLRVLNDHQTSELIVAVGPVVLPAGGHAMIRQPNTQAIAVPITGYIRSITVELVDGKGEVLPNRLLHHVNIIAPERRELFSPIMQRVGAAGAETGSISLPKALGYPVTRGDSLVFTVMFDNPTGEIYEHVELRVRMKYTGAAALKPTVAIQPFYLDVMPPAGYHVYTLPPGKSSKSWEGSPAVPGRILGLGGHMHKYGTALRLEDVTKGKILWEATPVVDSIGDVVSMPRTFFLARMGLPLDPSHVYRLTAEYDNPTGKPIEGGAMGALGGVFATDERASWPQVDRTNPDYIADVKVTYARNSGAGTHHHH